MAVRDIPSIRPWRFSHEMGIIRTWERGEWGADSKSMKASRLTPGFERHLVFIPDHIMPGARRVHVTGCVTPVSVPCMRPSTTPYLW